MARKSPEITIEQLPGEKFDSLESAQRAALPGLAADFAESIRRLIEEGSLIIDKGHIIPNPKRCKPNE